MLLVIGKSCIKCWLSVNTSDKFIILQNILITEKLAKFLMFNAEIDILFFRKYIFLIGVEDSSDAKGTKVPPSYLLQKVGLSSTGH